MSTYRLDRVFRPESVAVVGVSRRPRSLGRVLLNNLLAGGFRGPVYAVNPAFTGPEHVIEDLRGAAGVSFAASLEELAAAPPDLVVLVSPSETIVDNVAMAGRMGCSAAILAPPSHGVSSPEIVAAVQAEARRHGLRLIGPGGVGVISPRVRLNASLGARMPGVGDLALISQSGAIANGLVDWASQHQIGFSGVISIGEQADIDVADCLDYFAADDRTRSIILYVEDVVDAPKFMAAARAAARAKPVVVLKPGRHEARPSTADMTSVAALATRDAVHDAAFRRAGLLRVFDLDELFSAAETLGRQRPFYGRRLAIMVNDRGVGAVAHDRLLDLQGELAELAPETRARLEEVMPERAPVANPVDTTGYMDPESLAKLAPAILLDRGVDALLVINIPSALADPVASARALVETVRNHRRGRALHKPVLAVWMSSDGDAGPIFDEAGIPHFRTEAEALAGFMHLVRYRAALDLLMETPDALPHDFAPDVEQARAIVGGVIAGGREWLDPVEVQGLLRAYEIPAVPATFVPLDGDVAAAARPLLERGERVVVKVVAPGVLHRTRIGGVRLDLRDEAAVRAAAAELMEVAQERRLDGFVVQPMVSDRKARDLIVGITDDPQFGPVIMFGRGGSAVAVINDVSLALPPLDLKLAEVLIARTRVARRLKGYRDMEPADEHAIRMTLVKLSQIAVDLPEVRELEINPLLSDARGVVALNARVRVAPAPKRARRVSGHPRLSVRPYPKAWERAITARDGRVFFVRPVRPEDEQMFIDFMRGVSEDDLRLRFFAPVRDFNHAFVARLVQVDYARAIAFVAMEAATGRMVGVVRLHADSNHDTGEYAIMVASDLKGTGLGMELMRLIIEWAKADGISKVVGQVLRDNQAMLGVCRKLGFSIRADREDPSVMIAELPLEKAQETQ
ncbi:bifunctional acetate--CoA ligase family protein/GNAT family N-acetyltransferase [Camelimonas abortus]|uniref:Bifunctional acetate--CoA ligase family protein/GNAT family N-acetyltransferase n=1 Tax=Camelimonas abortus TaxID=1017184 RepID=A0ABV7LDL7_9HYPH